MIVVESISPEIFFKRLACFDLLVFSIQFFHIVLFTLYDFQVLLVLFFVHFSIQFFLILFINLGKYSSEFKINNFNILFFFIVFVFFIKISSRYEYINFSIFDDNSVLYNNRKLELGVRFTTYFSIFFYPLAILLPFSRQPRWTYIALIVMVSIIALIDMVFIGSKNAPIFVLIFYVCTARFKIATVKMMLIWFLLGFIFVMIFQHTIIGRTSEALTNNFDWEVLLKNTGSTEILKIDFKALSVIAKYEWAYPIIFLNHYLSHSIAELTANLGSFSFIDFNLPYITDQICAVGLCDRSQSSLDIALLNDRHNVYATMYTTIFFDFGVFFTSLLMFLGFVYSFVKFINTRNSRPRKKISLGFAVIGVWFSVGSIENYFYNGLGLVQLLLCFIIIGVANVVFKSQKERVREEF